MKQGKVFEKLAARKNVESIVFAANSCTVTLKDGSSLLCTTAHQARLFIEGKPLENALIEVPTPRDITITRLANDALLLQPQPELDAFCPAEIARYCTVSADWVRRVGAGLDIEVPAGAANVRVTPRTMAALILNQLCY